MELLLYAMLKPIIPFVTILALSALGWALSDLAAWRLTGRESTIWAFAILVFPPLGSVLYGLLGKKESKNTEEIA